MKDYQQTSTLQQQTLGTSRNAQSSPFTLHGTRSGVAVVCHAPRAASFAVVAVNPRRQVATVAKIATDRGGNAFQQSTTNQPMFNQHHKQCTTHNKTHNVRRLLNLPRGPSADRFIAAALNAQCTTNDLHNVSMMQRQSQPDTWLPADRFIDQCVAKLSQPMPVQHNARCNRTTLAGLVFDHRLRILPSSLALGSSPAVGNSLRTRSSGTRASAGVTPDLIRCVRPP